MLVGLISAVGSVVLGTLIGLVSGYFGGWVDEVIMRFTDVAFGIPFLPFALIVISIAGPSLPLVILLVMFFLWRTTSRVIRAQVLTLKTRPFVWAARAAGAANGGSCSCTLRRTCCRSASSTWRSACRAA